MAWTYKIKSTRQDGETLFVNVEYYNDAGVLKATADVPVFQPQSKDDVVTALKNRAVTIKRKINAEKNIADVVKPETDKDINVPSPAELA